MPTRLPILLTLLFAGPAFGASSGWQAFDHLRAELLAERAVLVPGERTTLALRFQHDPHWHTYWENPGDSGLPTRIRWQLPEGVTAGPIQWPAPTYFDVGGIHNFGYDGESWLLVDLHADPALAVGVELAVAAEANWLVCEQECIPGRGRFELKLQASGTSAQPEPAALAAFAKARAALPQPAPATWQARVEASEAGIHLLVEGDLAPLADADAVSLYVAAPAVIDHAPRAPQRTTARLGGLWPKNDAYVELPTPLPLVLVAEHEGSRAAYALSALPASGVAAELPGQPLPLAAPAMPSAPAATAPIGALTALVFALLGGLILNLMPCVFPVLSLKALAIAEGHGDARARSHALWYTAGVLLSFAAVGGLVLLLRGLGQALGWGFQMQTPWFVAALMYLFVVLGLSLSGAVTFGARLTGFGQSLTEGDGARSAFLTGVLACVVASPCAAPFMGSALGYSLGAPLPLAMGIFVALGLGLALPFLLLGYVPAFSRWLPRPGAWMETLKQFLAFPLYLTSVWLAWILMYQIGADGAALALVGVVLLALALWWYEKIAWQEGPRRLVHVGLIVLVAAVAAAPIAVIARGDFRPAASASTDAVWRPYSAAALAELRAAGTPVLIDMTAAWCATCKVNERIALSSERFRGALERHGIVAMKGDWTDHDAEITAFLQQFGAAGVPLYVVYPRGPGAPEVLPQVLTPSLVLDALERAARPPGVR